MNILLINADQLRHDSVGYSGLRGVKTPRLDQLAAEGIAYTSAYTPLPVCSPARQALLSGLRPDVIGATWNYDFMPTPELHEEGCWPIELKKKGYKTGYIGRFHVSPTKKAHDFGYEEFVDKKEYKEKIAKEYPHAEYTGGWLGCESPIPVEDSESHWMADKACGMIKSFAKSKKPWHVWVDFEIPHLPCRPSYPYSRMYNPDDIEPWDGWGDAFENKPYIHKQQTFSWDTKDLTWDDFKPMVALYYGWITQLDDAIGKILDTLKETGQYDDTVIIFTSDHGDMCASHSMLDKHYVLYDDIIRVPLIVKVPGEKSRVSDAFVMNCLDIPYSIRRWTGLSDREGAHGRMLPMTEDEDMLSPDEVLVTSNGQQFGLYTTRAIRTRTHKYVWNLTDVDEFYDLTLDPGEKHNRIANPECTEIIRILRRRLSQLLIENGDRYAGNEWMKKQLREDKIYIPDWVKPYEGGN
ncbi:MAG: sulfatase-like hydrolase/transferase [Clostridia bacterium]|nr:sulfatase-like hydrolase/transferase [Clostridia bacterium]MBQ4157469.1 sulfatase-like hydrolase/transferase [Clostridia bacterium]